MYCTKCGNELPDASNWCPKCGAAIDAADTASPEAPKEAPAEAKSNKFLEMFKGKFLAPKEAISALDKSEQSKEKKLLLIVGLIQFVLLILFYCSFGGVKASGSLLGIEEARTYSFTFREFVDVGILRFLVFVCLLGSAALCILPTLQDKAIDKRLLLVSKIIAILHILLEIFCMIGLADAVKQAVRSLSRGEAELLNLKASWHLSFGGWLSVLLSVAAAVLLFYISSLIKKKKEA